MRSVRAMLCIGSMLMWGVGPALAHKGSDAYLDVQQVVDIEPANARGAVVQAYHSYRFVLAVAIKDLDLLVPIDANADAQVTWGEVKTAMPMVLALLNETANTEQPASQGQGPAAAPTCRLDWQSDGVERRSDGTYIRLTSQARCPITQALAFRYTLFKDRDATHRLLVAGRIADSDLLSTTSPQQPTSLLLRPGANTGLGSATGAGDGGGVRSSSRWSALQDYFGLGMHHLLEGYDHLAFLLALVLPLRLSLLRTVPIARSSVVTSAAPVGPGGGWLALLRTVTAFTLGHSITLMLATFGWTQASPLWVEPVIALSIAVTALLNLRPVPWLRTDVLALVFGMVHGFGFAGLLQEAAAPSGLLPWALAGFNVGVEAGQLIAVSGWVLVSQLLVARAWYPNVVVRGGSVLLILLASWWFWQRVS